MKYLLFAVTIFLSSLAIGSSLTPQAAPVVKREKITVSPTGTDGSATGTGTTNVVVSGRVVRVDVDYGSTVTNTTDITIAQVSELVVTLIVVKANSATDAQYFPTVGLTDNGGTARTYDGTRPVVDYYPVSDRLVLTVTQSTSGTNGIVAEIYYVEER